MKNEEKVLIGGSNLSENSKHNGSLHFPEGNIGVPRFRLQNAGGPIDCAKIFQDKGDPF